MFYPLLSIPNSGERRALVIYDRLGKKEHGSVTLWFSIGVKEKKAPIEVKQATCKLIDFVLVSIIMIGICYFIGPSVGLYCTDPLAGELLCKEGW